MKMDFEMDAFSDGQVGSKLWACEKLEEVPPTFLPAEPVIWILGGWTGVLPFMIFTRDRLRPRLIRSFDLDENACQTAELINKYWERQGQRFRAIAADCQGSELWDGRYGEKPDLVINTACEHFLQDDWFDRIPPRSLVLLQSTDQPHDEEVRLANSASDLVRRFPRLSPVLFEGEMSFVYPQRRFRRFMAIGRKS